MMILHLMAVLAAIIPYRPGSSRSGAQGQDDPGNDQHDAEHDVAGDGAPKISAGARVIFGAAALLENTPFELYTLIRSGSLIQLQAATRNASGDHEPTHDLEICRDLPRPSGSQDSPLEGAGFELSVPVRQAKLT